VTLAEWTLRPVARGELQRAWALVRSRPTVMTGLIILGVLVICAILPGQIAPHNPTLANPHEILKAPSPTYWFGTDQNGMDIFSRIVWGSRVDLTIAVLSTAIACVLGTLVGAWAGYFSGRGGRGWLSEILMRGVDALQAFPVYVLALGLVAVSGPSELNILLVLAVLSAPIFLRLTRNAVLSVRKEEFVDAAWCSGNSEVGTLMRHVLPNSLSPSLVTASVVAGGAILVTAGLSFIGAGVQAPTPEWGSMVSIGAPDLYTGQWWPAFFPGAAIGLAVLSLAWVGDGLREYLDPTGR
jgi:peptide/nickel transport system permease protein